MASGNPLSALKLTYPDYTIQNLVTPWWMVAEEKDYRRGRLVWAYVPHVGLEPLTLEATGRAAPTDHQHATFRIRTLRVNEPRSKSQLPVASLTLDEGEVHTVQRSKRRPALVLSSGGENIPQELLRGDDNWQTQKSILIAPYYGSAHTATRAGWLPELVERIKRCEYSQFLWDLLPLDQNPTGSVLMMNRIQPIGDHYNSLGWTKYCLTPEALDVIDEWILWSVTGNMRDKGTLATFQQIVMEGQPNP